MVLCLLDVENMATEIKAANKVMFATVQLNCMTAKETQLFQRHLNDSFRLQKHSTNKTKFKLGVCNITSDFVFGGVRCSHTDGGCLHFPSHSHCFSLRPALSDSHTDVWAGLCAMALSHRQSCVSTFHSSSTRATLVY